MAFGIWNMQNAVNIKNECFCVSEESFEVNLAGEGYSYIKFTKRTDNIKPKSFYRVTKDLCCEGVEYKITFTCLSSSEEQLSKGYVEEDGLFLTSEDTASAEIGIMVFSENKGNFILKSLDVSFEREYEKRPARLCSVCIDYGEYGSDRSCEMNMKATVENINRALKEKPDIIVLTETFYNRRVMGDAREYSLPLDCEPVNILRETARDNNCYIAFSFALTDKDGYYRNGGILIDRKGNVNCEYNKCHLTLSEYEKGMKRGDKISVFDTDFGKIGFAICWDLYFPEHIRELRKQGAEIIINPTAGFSESRIKERAYENGVFIITSAVDEADMTRITAPSGEVLSKAGEEGYAFCEVDLNKPYYTYWLSCPSNTTSRNIFINEMRPDLY